MATLYPFKNCSNLTFEQTEVIALVSGVSGAVCGAILSTVLVGLVILAILPKTRKRLVGTVVKRLFFVFIAVCVLYEHNLAIHLVYYYHYDEEYCKVNGFFIQYFLTVGVLLLQNR